MATTGQPDPLAIIRSRGYVQALVLTALIGAPISAIAYAFLAIIDWAQGFLYEDLPGILGFSDVPIWWPAPLLTLAGLLVALSIARLPGNGGHSPALGLKVGGSPAPAELPGIALAALATLALGAVLGPEAPLIAIGGGLGALTVKLVKRDAPPPTIAVISAAGSFAAISTLLGSPLLGAFLIMEAAAIGGGMMSVALLPGLLAAGIGSLVFVGLDAFTGLGTFSLAIPDLPAFDTPTAPMFGYALLFGLLCPLLGWGIYTLGRSLRPVVHRNRLAITPVLGLSIAVLAIAFGTLTGKSSSEVLFSGQAALPGLLSDSASWSIGAVVLLIVFKGLAYGLSLSAFRGGPVFPSLFIGAAIGLIGAQLPGMELVPAVGIGIGAMGVSMLRLPFTSVLLATYILASDGTAVMPLVIVAVVVAHVVTAWLPDPLARSRHGAPAEA